jgi:hypothetical protein
MRRHLFRRSADRNSTTAWTISGRVLPAILIVSGCVDSPTSADEISAPRPLVVATSEPYTQVSAGGDHTCAVKSSGFVTCWGANGSGESTPPLGQTFHHVSASGEHTCGLKTDGSIACWGLNTEGQSSPPAGFEYVQVSSQGRHGCALKTDGSISCWGLSDLPPAQFDFVQVSAAGRHTCALRSNGTLTCWGVILPPPPGNHFVSVSTRRIFGCAINAAGNSRVGARLSLLFRAPVRLLRSALADSTFVPSQRRDRCHAREITRRGKHLLRLVTTSYRSARDAIILAPLQLVDNSTAGAQMPSEKQVHPRTNRRLPIPTVLMPAMRAHPSPLTAPVPRIRTGIR